MNRSRGSTVSAVVAGLLVLTACSNAEPTEDVDAGAVAPGSETSTTSTASDGEPDQEPTPAIEIAAEFVRSRDELNVDDAMALLSPDAKILDFGFWPRTPEDYPGLFAWMEIFDWRWDLQECTELAAGPPTRVLCTHQMHNAWSRAQGVDPVDAEIEFLVAEGLIVEVNSDFGQWGPIFVRWIEWLQQAHPTDVPIMYRFDDDERLTGGPATTPEALDLFRQHLPEYLEWEAGQGGG